MSASQTLRDQMYSLIEEWMREGGVQKIFCNKHGISVLKFQYWHKRYKEEKSAVACSQPSFMEIDMPAPQKKEHCGGQAEVILPNGIRILLHHEVSAHFLKALV
jgi:hypothetical protein